MSSSNGIVYKVSDLVMEYDGRRVLHLPELMIESGEIFSLVGPSGSGKSTLLRLLNFLEFPSNGSILFDGISYRQGVEIPLNQRRRVTTVFQRPMLLDRSVWDNVSYGLRIRGLKDSDEKIQVALELVGLEKQARQRARTLSGGEAQRVALARALVVEPDVLLLDEPTANLDPYNVAIIEQIIRRTNQDHHTTTVLVTHNIFQAHRLAHRVAFLLEGSLIEVADVKEFFETPRDRRTAAFVRGDMVY
jgi:tungstate transport system ATP-binding protein